MKVLLFARLREALGAPAVELPADDPPATVGELRQRLRDSEHTELATAMGDPNVFCAVNQRVVDDAQRLAPGDEVAFYPPVTGG